MGQTGSAVGPSLTYERHVVGLLVHAGAGPAAAEKLLRQRGAGAAQRLRHLLGALRGDWRAALGGLRRAGRRRSPPQFGGARARQTGGGQHQQSQRHHGALQAGGRSDSAARRAGARSLAAAAHVPCHGRLGAAGEEAPRRAALGPQPAAAAPPTSRPAGARSVASRYTGELTGRCAQPQRSWRAGRSQAPAAGGRHTPPVTKQINSQRQSAPRRRKKTFRTRYIRSSILPNLSDAHFENFNTFKIKWQQ